jgi:hypothetical protein
MLRALEVCWARIGKPGKNLIVICGPEQAGGVIGTQWLNYYEIPT